MEGTKLGTRRRAAGVILEDFALTAGITTAYLRRIETGQGGVQPYMEALMFVAERDAALFRRLAQHMREIRIRAES